MAILIQAAHIDYAHGGNQIFRDATHVVKSRDRVAIIGENGSGKSTLFRLLTREIPPDAGEVTFRRGISVGYLRQDSPMDPNLSVRASIQRAVGDPDALEFRLLELEEALASPLSDDEMAATLDEYNATLERLDSIGANDHEAALADVLGGLAFPEHRWDQRVGELSGGERKLVDLARQILTSPDVLLFDEPENHFDFLAREWLENWLRHTYMGAVHMVSHDRYMIDAVADRIVEIEDGRFTDYPGNYSAYLQLKQQRAVRQLDLRELAEREYKKLKESAEQLTQWARQNPKFATRAEQQRTRMAEERARLDAEPMPVLARRRIKVEFPAVRGSTDLVVADNARKTFGERALLHPFDMTIQAGERIGLIGANGSGKTTLVRMILGEEPTSGGVIRVGASVQVGYYAQQHETLDPRATPLDTVRRVVALDENRALGFLGGLLFDRDDAMNDIARLSGGERARLQIGLMILQGANLLILDEPTNNLDLASVEVLEDALLEFPGAILTISHDRFFLDRVCTHVIQLQDGDVRRYPGGYSYAIAHPDNGSWLTHGKDRIPEPAPRRKRRP